jgi:hypothetical protein
MVARDRAEVEGDMNIKSFLMFIFSVCIGVLMHVDNWVVIIGSHVSTRAL